MATRDWQQFHAGAIDEADAHSRDPATRERIAAEVADVGIGLLLLCERIGLDFVEVMRVVKNAERYPVEGRGTGGTAVGGASSASGFSSHQIKELEHRQTASQGSALEKSAGVGGRRGQGLQVLDDPCAEEGIGIYPSDGGQGVERLVDGFTEFRRDGRRGVHSRVSLVRGLAFRSG